MITPKFIGMVKGGKLVVDRNDEYQNYLRYLEGQKIEIVVQKWRNTRSLQQSHYYFGVVVKLISNDTGYSLDETHEILKAKFLGEETRIGDEVIKYSKSTTSLKTMEFEEYLTNVREWASAELNCFIPLPSEIEY